MEYNVTASAMNRKTRRQVGKIRNETINTLTNKLFNDCKTPLAVEQRYEAFWNDLNPSSQEIVKVISIE